MHYDIRNVIKHTSVYSIGRMASKGIGFLLIPLYTNYLSPEDYGIVELLTIFVTLSSIVIQGGISAAIFKFYNSYPEENERKQLTGTVLLFVTITCLIFVILAWFLSDKISLLLLNKKGYGYYLMLMLISFFFSTVGTVPETLLMAKKKSKLYAIISFAVLFVQLILNIYLIVVADQGVLGILYASIIARFLHTFIIFIILIPEICLKLNLTKLKEVLKFTYPLIPGELALFFYAFSDRLFLAQLSDLKSVGLYSLGYKFAFMISFLVVQPFMQIWQQEMYEVKKKDDAPHIFGRIYTYLIGVIMIISLLMSIFIKDILSLISSPEFHGAWKVVPIIAFAYVFRTTYLYFQMGMLFKNKTIYISYVTVTGALVVLLLNYLLIPRYGAIGAALATLGSYFTLAFGAFIISQKLYRVNIEVSRLLKLIVVSILALAAYEFVKIDSKVFSIAVRSTSIPFVILGIYLSGFLTQDEISKIKSLVFKDLLVSSSQSHAEEDRYLAKDK